MNLSIKAKNRLALAFLIALVGIVGEMDYRDAVNTELAAKELRSAQVAKWTTYQINH